MIGMQIFGFVLLVMVLVSTAEATMLAFANLGTLIRRRNEPEVLTILFDLIVIVSVVVFLVLFLIYV